MVASQCTAQRPDMDVLMQAALQDLTEFTPSDKQQHDFQRLSSSVRSRQDFVCQIRALSCGLAENNRGAGIARHFAKSGYSVALLARTESTVNEIAKSIRDEGYSAYGFSSDTSSAALKSAFEEIDGTPELKGIPLK